MLTTQNTNAVSSVVTLKAASTQLQILEAIFTSLDNEFQKMKNPIAKTHAICTTGSNSIKTDAIKAYVAMIIKFHLNSNGSLMGVYTKESIAEFPNFLIEMFVNTLATRDFTTHEEVFKTAASTILGFDPMLIDAALASDEKTKARLVYKYIAARYETYFGIQPVFDSEGNKIKEPLDVYMDMFANQEELDSLPSMEVINKLLGKALAVTGPWFDLLEALVEVSHE